VPSLNQDAIAEFGRVVGLAVAEALRAQPLVAQVPDVLVQALQRLAAQPLPVSRPVLDPIAAMQQQLQLQGIAPGLPNIAPGQPRPYQVMRMDDNGRQYLTDATIPQLLAEMCDLLHDACARLEEISAAPPSRPRRRKKEPQNVFG